MSLSLAENVIVARADNRPSMLDNTNYSSWASRMMLYIKGKEYGKLLVDSVLNGPFQYGTIVEPRNENTPATDRVKLLIQGSELSLQELVLQQPYQAPALQQSYQAHAIQQPSQPSFPELDSGLAVEPSSHSRWKSHRADSSGETDIGCTKPKRPKNSTWFKEKMLLPKALESGAYLDPEQLAFLADNGDTFTPVQASQEIPSPAAFQTDDLYAFDSDCDDAPLAKAVLMANLSSYDSNVISEVPFHDTNIENDMSYDAVIIRDFYKKFYNSIGRVPNRCSNSIGKTRGLLSFSRGIG
ncbi:hypothetical protein Tco_1011246 [Tanacetum coccineum]